MAVRIAINGFGRIGRNILRALAESDRNDINIVAINSTGSIETNAHLLKYDSIHGRYKREIKITQNSIDVGLGPIAVLTELNPERLPWKDLNIDIVFECTGKFTDHEKAILHLKAGAKKVLVSAPSKGADITVVYGVNHNNIKKTDNIISSASCTTNALAPIASVLNNKIGIESGFVTAVHSYTGDQPTIDKNHKDLYRARAAAMSMIPTSTGAAAAVGLILPELSGKLDGVSIRVPTPNVSLIDFKFISSRSTTVDEINNSIIEAANNQLKGVLNWTEEKLVSTDFNHDPHSSIFAIDQTRVIDSKLVRVMSWYDNEWGFSNRMNDLAAIIGKLI
ncbi:type I glyceraldehyde-3-phosphate dehydrogenase [Hyphomicrobiales bacterium]|jgi:glyceraldehyde 3-phosphate dehydrogenase|nr:type I glyceraldehyde-3-phosphate dehydrogenase [Hyphomicrobiales bacterium]MDC3272863.1 type I glyceraldehyde-3-phosphate dehydrogenase [Hyphomicrobiales bacterium]|tara:strand:- start:2473 stop:3480 length:1008 start_codon:yes stop_codon:yes gene_type:complete